jgi:four helix bundle protein
MENDLQVRLLRFAVALIKTLRKLPKEQEYKIISNQLIKSSASAGANYEEAQGAVSKADFSNKVGISLKEMRESNYWIRMLHELSFQDNEWKLLLNESEELMKILGSVYFKTATHR